MRISAWLQLVALWMCACKSERATPSAARPPAATSAAAPTPVRRLDPPAAAGAMAPNLATTGDVVLATWLEPAGKGHRLRMSRMSGKAWSTPVTIAEGDAIVGNWADVPSVAKGGAGALVAHWVESNAPDGARYDVILARSTNGGGTWTRLGPAHDDGTPTEHGFVSLIPDGDAVRAYWLDGRETGGGHGGPGGHGAGAMTLRTALVGEAIADSVVVDARVCDCCGTGAAVTAEGPVVVFRDRSADEIRDISIVRRAGAGWSEPRPVHADGWQIAGCPVNGPVADARGRHAVVAWYTYAAGRPLVRAAFSDDAGATFGAPIEVDAPEGRRAPIGRVDVVLDDDGSAVVSWLASEREQAVVRLRRVTADGRTGAPITAVETTVGRDAGFPRLARLGPDLVIAWTETGDSSHVRAALVAIAAVPAAIGSGRAATPAIEALAAVGRPAPEYAAETLDGKPASLAALRGEVVLVNIWATWCEPCRAELPILAAVHERWSARGLRVVGVSVDQSRPPADVRAFVERREVPYAIWMDREDRASRVFGVGALPATMLVDRKGVITWRRDGAVLAGDATLEAAIAATLEP